MLPPFTQSARVQALPGVEVPKTAKPRVVILGSGWGAISFMKALPKETAEKYDIVLISPRNYFLYTPLLPAVATGTMEERSIVEPIRNVVLDKGEFYEAVCQTVDPATRTLTACFPKDAGFPEVRLPHQMHISQVNDATFAGFTVSITHSHAPHRGQRPHHARRLVAITDPLVSDEIPSL